MRRLLLLLVALLPLQVAADEHIGTDGATAYCTAGQGCKAGVSDRAEVLPGTVAAAWDTASVAHDTITGSYASFLANASAHRWRICIVYNDTNGDVALDNGTTAIVPFLAAGAGIVLDLGANGRDIRTAIRIKHINDPTADSVYISCGY